MDWCGKIEAIMTRIEHLQSEFELLFERKLGVLVDAKPLPISEALEQERNLQEQMTKVLKVRDQLIQLASTTGQKFGSLREICEAIGDERGLELTRRIQASERKSRRLRHQSWVSWVMAQRGARHCREALALVANAGRRETTYGDSTQATAANAVLFDASA